MSSDPTSSSKPPTSVPFPPRAAPPRAGQGFGLLSAKSPGATPIPPSLQAKMAAMANRGAAAAAAAAGGPGGVGTPGVAMPAAGRAPVPGGMAARRAKPGFKLSDIEGAGPASAGPMVGGLGQGRPNFQDENQRRPSGLMATPFSTLSKIVDPSGALRFGGKAILTASGVDFSNGQSFAINMNQLELHEDLGKGNYGTVKRVIHRPTNVAMAMKEIRLELDDAKLNAIIMELDILHRAVAPEIVEFYGAFFVESCVYYCMEYMDAGSMDKLQQAGVPEPVLGRVMRSMVRGLKFLKDELQIMHRDVKPTNVLVNKKGQVKLCDFGVSGQLEKSLAKTNIGCQSYMAPERIKGESTGSLGTYTVSSDVWSLGLSAIEMALGRYPYPPETYANVFAQLTAIVHGDPPELPEDGYGPEARDFVARCLEKIPERRATYAELLEHPFLIADSQREVDMVGWVAGAIAARQAANGVVAAE